VRRSGVRLLVIIPDPTDEPLVTFTRFAHDWLRLLARGAFGEAVLRLDEPNVGGYFTTNGTVAVNGIVQWDGANWSALGSGVSSGAVPAVAAIESDGTSLYIGGMFATAGGLETMNVARWDGATWSALGTGLNGPVRALAFHGGNLYAGGSF